MAKWNWLEKPEHPLTWLFMLRVVIKAAILFALINVVFALLTPMETLGKLSLYNIAFPGRDRLPYGENPSLAYNLSTYNVPAMFASHEVSTTKADDEYRVLFMGDSATWGWYLENENTFTGQIKVGDHRTADGKRIVAYNLGYPIMSLTKDLMLLEYALGYEPDLIVWLFTLESFPREKQLFPPLVQNNADRVRDLIRAYELNLDAGDPRFVETDFIDRTIVGQRRELANLLRLQFYGTSWAATDIDQYIPEEFNRTSVDVSESITWEGIEEPRDLTTDDLAFDVLQAGVEMAGGVPVLLVNEPMLVSDGENSDVRYNAFFPRWAYDSYHDLLLETAETEEWDLLDLWDLLPPSEFTDTPVHTTAQGADQTAAALIEAIMEYANSD